MHESASAATLITSMPIWKRSKRVHWIKTQQPQVIAGIAN